AKHDFDLLFWRYLSAVKQKVSNFRADVIHITGPSDVGMLGALVADQLKIPLVASWHTNVHEYAKQRALPLLKLLPANIRLIVAEWIQSVSLRLIARFYKIPRVLFAPNPELIRLMETLTGKPCYPMGRGVDLNLFSPRRRTRHDGEFVFGYVG